ncbi:MAG TPA: antitoxin [Thermoanaerobaculia bacterium]|jgi:hypothetical protein|nr:antitoxin [Thermoanaerobaculia bacterium]
MARTTLNLDDLVLVDLRRLQRKEGNPLDDLASELLTSAIAARKSTTAPDVLLPWTSRPMGALVNLGDKETLFAVLDEHGKKKHQQS